MEIDAEEIGNPAMADANPTRNQVTVSHATVVMKTGNQALNMEIVVEKHPALPIKPFAEVVEN